MLADRWAVHWAARKVRVTVARSEFQMAAPKVVHWAARKGSKWVGHWAAHLVVRWEPCLVDWWVAWLAPQWAASSEMPTAVKTVASWAAQRDSMWADC